MYRINRLSLGYDDSYIWVLQKRVTSFFGFFSRWQYIDSAYRGNLEKLNFWKHEYEADYKNYE